MTRQEAIEKFAMMLQDHRPHPVFGCECTPIDPASKLKTVFTGSWETHIATLAIEAVKGF